MSSNIKAHNLTIVPKLLRPHNRHAFSLLEMTVTLAVVGIVIAMLSNVLTRSIQISQRTLARSFVREELADITDRIASDIREATAISTCEGEMQTAICEMVLNETVMWGVCQVPDEDAYQVCKRNEGGTVLYRSSPSLKLEDFSFEQGFDGTGASSRKNILLTVVGSHANANFKVNNLVVQTAISTRNYYLIPN